MGSFLSRILAAETPASGSKKRSSGEYSLLLDKLQQLGIHVLETNDGPLPPEARMHDRAAPIPALVISPRSEWGVARVLKTFKDLGLYDRLPISVKSGGHGYFNGASCTGIMVNLGDMTRRRIENDTLFLEPGCLLGQTINALSKGRKAVPHGDCFGVAAGGHFLTAGWDLILARRYGLGCQSVIGGRIVLWDGSVVDVDEKNHPALLHAMRGGAAAGAGIVTEVRLSLIEEPPLATWRFTRINKEQLAICVAKKAYANAFNLPRDISVSFRFHFEPDQLEPVCSFNVVSLLTRDETLRCLNTYLGSEVTSLVAEPSAWNEKSLVDLRMLPASDFLASNPDMLAEVTSEALHRNPLTYWKETSTEREMASSFFTSISHWVVPDCEDMLTKLYAAFESAQMEPSRKRMYALVIQGGGRMSELQDRCSMPLGKALARFELHWDNPEKEERWCRRFTDNISGIIQTRADKGPGRPYRGDIWLQEQAGDEKLDAIHQEYDRRRA
ncbi:hypothetical protein GGR54DRAFT_598606 [Hypoxylon sp. NC1633]|nr:hypothetical protein GGR54DRAFT_598606 [Hypoxylon sp. NC1633]